MWSKHFLGTRLLTRNAMRGCQIWRKIHQILNWFKCKMNGDLALVSGNTELSRHIKKLSASALPHLPKLKYKFRIKSYGKFVYFSSNLTALERVRGAMRQRRHRDARCGGGERGVTRCLPSSLPRNVKLISDKNWLNALSYHYRKVCSVNLTGCLHSFWCSFQVKCHETLRAWHGKSVTMWLLHTLATGDLRAQLR